MFARGGNDRPSTIAEAARAIYDGFKTCSLGQFTARRRAQPARHVLLHIIARGKIGRSPEADLVERYLKRIAWPTKLTELPERAAGSRACRRAASAIVLDESGQALSSMELARRSSSGATREARSAVRDRGGRRPFDQDEGRCRPAAVLRPGHLAPPARQGDARRTTVPRDINPCEPPLSSRRLSAMRRLSLRHYPLPLLGGECACAAAGETIESR